MMATSKSSETARALLREHGVTADAVLNRALTALGITKDVELARLLGVSKTVISTWRRRNRVPFEELLSLHYAHGLDFVYCVLGISVVDHDIAEHEENRLKAQKLVGLAQELLAALSKDAVQWDNWPEDQGDSQQGPQ